jgi:outer membrane protein assembly factor BamB
MQHSHRALAAHRSVVAVLALLVSTLVLRSDDWPMFLGPRADGTSAETGLLEGWPSAGPRVVWSKAIGTGYSAPSVRAGRIVFHHRVKDEEIVECASVDGSKTFWRHASPTTYQDPYGYNNGPRCTPLLTTNRCYTFGAEGRLSCVDFETGKRVWERDTAKDFQIPPAFFGAGSTPVLEGTRLLVMVGGQPNAGMAAFDAETGKTLWESVGERSWTGVPMTGWPGERTVAWRAWDKQASYATPVLATVHGKRRAFCLMRQGLVSLDPVTGAVDDSFWFRSRLEDSVNASNPIVFEDSVLISAAYYKVGAVLLRIRPSDRKFETVWRDTVLETHWNTPILHGGFLYAFSGRNEPDARFRCVELKTGKLRWDRDESWRPHSSPTPPVYGRGSAIMADGKLFVLGEGGLLGLFRVNPEKPEELARFQVPGMQYPCWAAPILSDKRLFLRCEDRLICVDVSRSPTQN